MAKVLTLFLGLALLASPAFSAEIGPVIVEVNTHTIPVRVSADTPELNALAQRAFGTHGRYRVVASGYAYDIRFSQVSGTSERVDITKVSGGNSGVPMVGGGSEPFASEILAGTSARNALLRAADFAVEKTNGLGLRGFFASKIAFIGAQGSRKEVYVGDLFFGEVHQLTHDGAIAMFPRWSPDGGRLLYTSWLHGSPDIYLINLSTYQRSTFESFRGSNFSARFSPDGRQVAMILTGGGSSQIFVSDSQGRGLSRRTSGDAVKSSPCWSPDGSRIVYGCEPGPQLYVMSASGGGSRRIAGGFSGYSSEPDWSRANPNKIAFTAKMGGNFQIAVVDLSTGDTTVASKAAFDGMQPAWLPDGRHLVYTASNAHASRLCILDTETGNSIPISPVSFGLAMQASVFAR